MGADFGEVPLAFTFTAGLADDTTTGFAVTWGFAFTLTLVGFAGAALVTITAAGFTGADLALTVLAAETLLEVTARLWWKGANPRKMYNSCQNSFCGVAVMIGMVVLQ